MFCPMGQKDAVRFSPIALLAGRLGSGHIPDLHPSASQLVPTVWAWEDEAALGLCGGPGWAAGHRLHPPRPSWWPAAAPPTACRAGVAREGCFNSSQVRGACPQPALSQEMSVPCQRALSIFFVLLRRRPHLPLPHGGTWEHFHDTGHASRTGAAQKSSGHPHCSCLLPGPLLGPFVWEGGG